ncbi:type II toxin-antitoxin system HicB family antitoxin [Halorubellus sp. PRR65]|uniref:type II toxin-antitoxin system HicB family antitoxin n=1 Tax=Halorubellus sp. PRR65 TaxID=3098148 RepID=UPI002B25EC40|nr:type II toxin-antitoxin system HicB family antitoxin [Halorubellus sp. PRR65]
MSSSREIRLIDEPDGGWSAIDVDTNVASQGDTREEALDNLDEALALHKGEAGEPIEDEEAFLEELGIDPDEVTGENEEDRPPFLS